jgi:hypothetical protein
MDPRDSPALTPLSKYANRHDFHSFDLKERFVVFLRWKKDLGNGSEWETSPMELSTEKMVSQANDESVIKRKEIEKNKEKRGEEK